MAKKRRTNHRPSKSNAGKSKGGRSKAGGDSQSVSLVADASGKGWVLRHPRCARDRAEDIEEVQMMIDAGELDVAQDELRWLLSGCSDCIDAHMLLGQVALDKDNDFPLARGHFGYAYQLGLRAWKRASEPTPVPYAQLANRSFHESGRSLAWCLEKLGKQTMADEVVNTLLKLDPSDPLDSRQMLRDLRDTGSLPML